MQSIKVCRLLARRAEQLLSASSSCSYSQASSTPRCTCMPFPHNSAPPSHQSCNTLHLQCRRARLSLLLPERCSLAVTFVFLPAMCCLDAIARQR